MLTPTILNFTHRACDGAKFRARSSALLEFAGKASEDVVEGEAVPAARLARATTHAAHDADVGGLLALEHRVCMCDSPVEGSSWPAVLLGMMLLLGVVVSFALGSTSLVRGENTYDAGGDLVVDDRLVVLAHDINTEFLRQTLAV